MITPSFISSKSSVSIQELFQKCLNGLFIFLLLVVIASQCLSLYDGVLCSEAAKIISGYYKHNSKVTIYYLM